MLDGGSILALVDLERLAVDYLGRNVTMPETVEELTRLPMAELERRWRAMATEQPATLADYYAELGRRNVARVNNLLLVFTAVVTVATVAALFIAIARP